MKTQRKPPLFFFLTFLFSWLVWSILIFFETPEGLFLPLLFLGAFGPSLSAIFLIQMEKDKVSKMAFWRRVFSVRQIGWKNFLLTLTLFPGLLVTGYFFIYLNGGSIPEIGSYFEGINSAGDVVYLMIFMLLGGPLAEELGWRGYVLEPLQEKFGRLKASLLIGFIWIIWHLPLFFIEGTSQFQKGFGFQFWSWSLQLMVLSILFTRLYNQTGRSILAAVLLHLFANFFYPLNLDLSGEIIFSAVRLLVILPIILIWAKPGLKPSVAV